MFSCKDVLLQRSSAAELFTIPASTMTVRVRIAPSPTGNLHIGTARTAVFNWLFARNQGGTFVLRIEDTDVERSRPEYTQNILEGLAWLGLNWDEGPFYQTQRLDLYRQAIKVLLDQGLAYRSYETSEELDVMREAQKARNEPPRYDNSQRHLTPEQHAAYEAEGRKPVIRFQIDDDRTITWNDLVRGEVTWKGRDLGGDMVIARAAAGDDVGQPLYNFVVVVDDMDMQISHVIRGEDHIGNTPKQILLYEALGAAIPIFGHTPLILNQAGAKLSKRDGVTSIFDFKRMGYVPEALVNYMTLLGWSPPDATQERFVLSEAAAQFSFERVNKAGAKFDWDKLNWLNSQYLHEMAIDRLTDLLIPYWQEAGYEFDAGDRSWLEPLTAVIAPSLVRLEDAVAMSRYLFVREMDLTEAATTQLRQTGTEAALKAILSALESVTSTALTEAEAQSILQTVVKSENLKRGLVMRSLRAALTCDVNGPDLIQSWLLLNQHQLDRPRLEQALAVATVH
jgi:glutamyl-tRNA synthetase